MRRRKGEMTSGRKMFGGGVNWAPKTEPVVGWWGFCAGTLMIVLRDE